MDLVRFVFTLGVIYITFDGLWNLFLWLVKQLFGLDKQEGWVYYLSKGISLYLLVTLTAITTLQYEVLANSQLSHFLYPAIGLIVLYFYLTAAMQRRKMKATISMDTQTLKRQRYDGLFLFAGLILYSLSLFFEQLSDTDLTNWFFSTISQIYDVFIFRLVIGLLAFFFLINILIKSIFATRTLLFSLFGWKDSERDTFTDRIINEQQQSQAQTEEFTDYEIIVEEEEDQTSGADNNELPAG